MGIEQWKQFEETEMHDAGLDELAVFKNNFKNLESEIVSGLEQKDKIMMQRLTDSSFDVEGNLVAGSFDEFLSDDPAERLEGSKRKIREMLA